MNIRLIRILNFLLIAILVSTGKFSLLFYVAAMHTSLEVLNSRPAYFLQRYKLYNFIFWAYELVLMERLRTFQFSKTTEWALNCAEHISFAIVICIKVYVYTALFPWKTDKEKWKRIVATVVVFTFLGFLNELFQNLVNGRSFFVLITDSAKDIRMNFIGTAIFFLTAYVKLLLTQRKTNLYF